MSSPEKLLEVYVDLPGEGSPTMRPTQAVDLGNGLVKLLPASDYDPEDEVWEFPPGSVVRAEKRKHKEIDDYLYAVKP